MEQNIREMQLAIKMFLENPKLKGSSKAIECIGLCENKIVAESLGLHLVFAALTAIEDELLGLEPKLFHPKRKFLERTLLGLDLIAGKAIS